jgi:hypothetical protein
MLCVYYLPTKEEQLRQAKFRFATVEIRSVISRFKAL